jgi:hypothetical protein
MARLRGMYFGLTAAMIGVMAGCGGGGEGGTGGSATGGGGSSGGGMGGSIDGGAAGADGGNPPGSGGTAGTSGIDGSRAAGEVGNGCNGELARNLTLQQVAVYQSVKIPVMVDGAEVSPGSRNASVIAGRDALFRLFVTVGAPWTTRELSARLTLTPKDGAPAAYYAKQTLATSSVDSDQSTTFQLYVPRGAMVAPLRYSVEIDECTPQIGTPGAARFPATGDIDLGVGATGSLKVTVIPVEIDGVLPDTSAAALAGYANYMAALYPITDISLSVGATFATTSPLDWSTTLDSLRAKRSIDKAAADVYYYGMVKPAATLKEYCGDACTAGIGFVVAGATSAFSASSRVALGVAYADQPSYETMAHEIGHNHGRDHAPCSTAGTMTGVDASYPYTDGALGSWGYDARTQTLVDPTVSTDIMGYCKHQWTSDYTYRGIATRVAAVNGVTSARVVSPATSRWRIMLVDQRGPRWGIASPDAQLPEGSPEPATIYDGTGLALATVIVYRTAIADIDASMVMVPEPSADWYAVAVQGSPPLAFVR